MNFKKKLKTRLYIALSYIVLGLILILVDQLTRVDNYFILAFGIAMLIMGILRIIGYRKITASDASIRQRELAETDERNRMMSERARSWAFSCTILIAGIVVIVLSLLGKHETAQPYAWLVCGMTCLYWVCRIILGKKY